MTPYYKYLRDIVAQIRRRLLYAARHSMPQMPYGERVMIIAPHPDDETFGAGNYICSLLAHGSRVKVVVLSSGERSLGDGFDEAEVGRKRESVCIQATSILGLSKEDIVFLRQPDGHVLTSADMVTQLQREIEVWQPDMVLTPGLTEVWSDHVNTADVVLRIMSDKYRVYHYWIWTWYYNKWPIYGQGSYCHHGRTYRNLKNMGVDVYLNSFTQDGVHLIGELPRQLLNSIRQDDELFCLMTVDKK